MTPEVLSLAEAMATLYVIAEALIPVALVMGAVALVGYLSMALKS